MCMAQLKRHLVVKQETRLCTSILGDILVFIHRDIHQQASDNRDGVGNMLLSSTFSCLEMITPAVTMLSLNKYKKMYNKIGVIRMDII